MANQGNIIAEAVSEEIWRKLVEDWGTQAEDFRELNFLQDYHGPYPHYLNPPEGIKGCGYLYDNDKISLLQIRYGSIPELNEGKPCLWFLFRHERDSDGQISDKALLQINVHLSMTKDDNSAWVPIAARSPNDVVNKATQHGPDIYALVAKIFEPNEWPAIEIKFRKKLKSEPVLVRMHNSQPLTNSNIGGIWKVDGIPF
jgi:hypothetical protein